MKKKIHIIIILCLAFALVTAALTGCGGKGKGQPAVGGYTADRAVTAEDRAIFNKAMGSGADASYDLKFVATQVVAGMNYRFTATISGAEPYTAYIYIYQPLQGEPQLTEIVKAK